MKDVKLHVLGNLRKVMDDRMALRIRGKKNEPMHAEHQGHEVGVYGKHPAQKGYAAHIEKPHKGNYDLEEVTGHGSHTDPMGEHQVKGDLDLSDGDIADLKKTYHQMG